MRPSLRYTSAVPLEEFQQSRCHAEVFASADVCAGNHLSSNMALLTFLPGQRPVNVIDMEFIAQLQATLVWLRQRRSPIAFTLLSSNVPGSFVAGADLKLQMNLTSEVEATALSASFLELTCLFHSMPFITVALIEGSAMGGGLELALACHLSFARPVWTKHGTEAPCLSLPEVKLGVLPGAGGCVRLPLRIGLVPALNMILQGSSITVSQAAKMGVVDAVWKCQSSAAQALTPSSEFFTWAVDQLIRKTVRSRSSDGANKNRLLSLALRFSPVSILFRQFIRRQINAKTGGHFPAPYAALDAVMHCWSNSVGDKCKQWPHQYTVQASTCSAESREFGRLAVSAESKALISLFLASKLPSKIAAPVPISSVTSTSCVAMTFSVDFKSPTGYTKDLIVAMLLSGIHVIVVLPNEGFECILSAAKKDLDRNVHKGTISTDAMSECVSRLQNVSFTDVALTHESVLLISLEESSQQPQGPLTPHGTRICCGPCVQVSSCADPLPALCCLKWSGCISTVTEIVIGHQSALVSDSAAALSYCAAAAAAAAAVSSAAAICRRSGFAVIFTASSMSAGFEVFCAIFTRAIFIVTCAANSASAAVSAVKMIDTACTSSGWDVGPFELADKLGAPAVSALLVEYLAVCERHNLHIGIGLRVASQVIGLLRDSTSSCKSFWSWSKNGTKVSVNSGIGGIIRTCADRMTLPHLPMDFWTHYYVHLSILMAASESCLSLLQRRAVANSEILDLLLVASGYPANQGGVIECARNTFALSEYEHMVSFAGTDALDSPSWRDAYAALFEWKSLTDRPRMAPCQSVSRLSRLPVSSRRIG
jgi:enoyl-CoA hydratase/carnithine racemase